MWQTLSRSGTLVTLIEFAEVLVWHGAMITDKRSAKMLFWRLGRVVWVFASVVLVALAAAGGEQADSWKANGNHGAVVAGRAEAADVFGWNGEVSQIPGGPAEPFCSFSAVFPHHWLELIYPPILIACRKARKSEGLTLQRG